MIEIGSLYFLKVSLDSSSPRIDASGTEDSDEIFAALSGVIIEVLGGPEDCIDKNERAELSVQFSNDLIHLFARVTPDLRIGDRPVCICARHEKRDEHRR